MPERILSPKEALQRQYPNRFGIPDQHDDEIFVWYSSYQESASNRDQRIDSYLINRGIQKNDHRFFRIGNNYISEAEPEAIDGKPVISQKRPVFVKINFFVQNRNKLEASFFGLQL